MSDTTIIEINGVKLEVDLRSAKRIEHLKVGDTVKVLTKNYNNYESTAGVIVGFDAFKNLPTIIIAHICTDYTAKTIKFVYFNSETKDVEIVPCNEHDIGFEKGCVIEAMDREIAKHEEDIRQINIKKSYFLHHFKKYFHETKEQ